MQPADGAVHSLKAEGNACFRHARYLGEPTTCARMHTSVVACTPADKACPRCAEATRLYGLALEIAVSSSGTDVVTVASVLLANRSAALLKQGQPMAALRDACACVQVRPVHKFPGSWVAQVGGQGW